MKNFLLTLALAVSAFASAQLDTIQIQFVVENFNFQDYKFDEIFYFDKEGNTTRQSPRTQLRPHGGFGGSTTLLGVGSMVLMNVYNRDGSFDHSFSAYIVRDENGKIGVKEVESSPLVSIVVGEQKSYVKFLIEAF